MRSSLGIAKIISIITSTFIAALLSANPALNPKPAMKIYNDALAAPLAVPLEETVADYPEEVVVPRLNASSLPIPMMLYFRCGS